ncbi:hypothetical protein BKA80DRAFT_276320 [Phyllosticta citrichinensis]
MKKKKKKKKQKETRTKKRRPTVVGVACYDRLRYPPGSPFILFPFLRSRDCSWTVLTLLGTTCCLGFVLNTPSSPFLSYLPFACCLCPRLSATMQTDHEVNCNRRRRERRRWQKHEWMYDGRTGRPRNNHSLVQSDSMDNRRKSRSKEVRKERRNPAPSVRPSVRLSVHHL